MASNDVLLARSAPRFPAVRVQRFTAICVDHMLAYVVVVSYQFTMFRVLNLLVVAHEIAQH